MIEIRELVIRATVEDSSNNSGERPARDTNQNRNDKLKNCAESIEQVLQIINDKKER
jgi:hypothetical protein